MELATENENAGKEESATRFWNIAPLDTAQFRKDKGKSQDRIHESLWRSAIQSGRQTENSRRRFWIGISLMRLR